jgi:hypothetical protein
MIGRQSAAGNDCVDMVMGTPTAGSNSTFAGRRGIRSLHPNAWDRRRLRAGSGSWPRTAGGKADTRAMSVVLNVTNRLPRHRNALPGRSGWLGLIVATSKLGFASAAIAFGGSGIGQASSDLVRTRFSGSGPGPYVQAPVMVLPSADIVIVPSYLPPMPSIEYFSTPFAKEADVAIMA